MSKNQDIWVPFDPAWVVRALEHPISLDPALKEAPEPLEKLKSELRAIDQAMLKENPDQSTNLIYYFCNPKDSSRWAVAYSWRICGEEADFLFNFLPDGSLGALQVWMHEAPAPV